MMAADEVVIQPHRRTLSATRVQDLQRTVRMHSMAGEGLGAAVAYRPSVGWVLVGGEHRWKALSAPGARTNVIILRNWDDLVAWMAIDITDPRRLGWDPIAAASFYEKAVAALKPSRGDVPLADVAEFTGVHRGVLESVRWGLAVVADADELPAVREYTQELLDLLERGGDGGHSVRERVQRFKEKLASAARAPQSVAVQRKAFDSITALEGIIGALSEIGPMNPDIPKSEREAWAARLGKLGTPLAKIKKTLRGEDA